MTADPQAPAPIILKALRIDRRDYGPDEGQYRGKITFDGPRGEITLALSGDQCAKMFAICADGIIESAKEVATLLVDEARAQLAHSADLRIA